jgi:hypothetical protein
MRELREFLAIPNVASDTPNIKNATRLKEMLEARASKPICSPSKAAVPSSSANSTRSARPAP